jgi:peptide deformylase
MKILRRTQFGNPILRQKARRLSREEILSDEIQALIKNMKHTLLNRNYGIGIAAPQVGQRVAISVIELRSTRTRPNLPKKEWLSMVIINPEVIKTHGKSEDMWEGCLSLDNVFAKANRYKKVRVKWQDEKAKNHEKDLEGLLAQVLQHETDHLNGILFVDKVKDASTYTSESEYLKMRKKSRELTGIKV